ncbi:MAG: tyrosine-protein phosphatase, partial [Ruminococcaceae bacterium]|nr:tyrosine-protein phosphatase [Oscillospiraceae bacterium]
MEFPYEAFTVTKNDNEYTVETELNSPAEIYWSASPDGFSDDHALETFTKKTVFSDPAYGIRIYFHIICGGRYYVAAARSIEAGNMLNLRDLGGYETSDGGGFVRYGQMFRSDMLCLCGEENIEKLERLRIRHVLDFRSTFDVTTKGGVYADPHLRGSSYELIQVYDDTDERFSFTFEDVVSNRESLEKAYEIIFNTYKTSVFGSPAYKKLFRYLADGSAPL